MQIFLCPALAFGKFDLCRQVYIVSFKLIYSIKLARRSCNYRFFVGNALLQVRAQAQLSLLPFHGLFHSFLQQWLFHSLFLFFLYSQMLKNACLLHFCGAFEQGASFGRNFLRFVRSEAFFNRLLSRVHCLCMLVALCFCAWHNLLAGLLSGHFDSAVPKGGHGVHFLILHEHVIIPPRVLRSCLWRV